MTQVNQIARVVDDPAIRETYADKVLNISLSGGALVVTMGVFQALPDCLGNTPPVQPPPIFRVSARLALSQSAGMELVQALSDALNTAALAQARPPQTNGGQVYKAS